MELISISKKVLQFQITVMLTTTVLIYLKKLV